MLGGRVQMNIGTISTLAPLVREGKLRALAITSAARNPELPDVPTMAESGLPEVASVTTYGLFGPAGMPRGRGRAAQRLGQREPEIGGDCGPRSGGSASNRSRDRRRILQSC